MADYLVYNRTDPKVSTHRAGIRITSTAVNRVDDIIAQYNAINASAATDIIEIVDASAIVSYYEGTARNAASAALPTAGT